MSEIEQRLILASASTARAAMLRSAGAVVQIEPAHVDEEAVKASFRAEGAPARDLADALAEIKAKRVSARHSGALVLGADQILTCDGHYFDKPADMAAARAQLIELRGKSHELLSAAVICENGIPVWRHVGAVRLTMRPFSDKFLDQYLLDEGDKLLSSVGAYQIEGRGSQLFSRISGDYFAILGLPLLEVLGFLRARGLLIE